MRQALRVLGLFAVLIIAAPAFGATTWTEDRSDARIRVSKAACTTGSEAAPADPVRAFETVTLTAIAAGDTFVITGASPSPVTFYAHATKNAGAYFKVGADDNATATNLVAAINRTALGVTAESQLAQVLITAKAYGTSGNGIALNYTGGFACLGACTLAGGVNPVGLDLYGVKGFAVHVEAAGAMTAGGKLVAYTLNPATMKWAPTPDLDLTVAALTKQGFAGFSVVSDWSRLAYVPSGVGQAATIYTTARVEAR